MSRTAIVTGAASGIGRSVARRFAAGGDFVWCVDVDEKGVAHTVELICSEGGEGEPIIGDVSNDADCASMLTRIRSGDPVSTLCNIAGITPYGTGLMECPPEAWDRVMTVNLRSVYCMSRHVVPVMTKAGATIVNTSSVHAFASQASCSPYAASKGAITSLTRQMAIELAAIGIRVVCVAPGAVETPGSVKAASLEGTDLGRLGFVKNRNALGRLMIPDEVAEVFWWLSLPSATAVNATTIVADAGLLAPLGHSYEPRSNLSRSGGESPLRQGGRDGGGVHGEIGGGTLDAISSE